MKKFYVYVAVCQERHIAKIGMSANPFLRMRFLKMRNKQRIGEYLTFTLLYVKEYTTLEAALKEENRLKEKYKNQRFNLSKTGTTTEYFTETVLENFDLEEVEHYIALRPTIVIRNYLVTAKGWKKISRAEMVLARKIASGIFYSGKTAPYKSKFSATVQENFIQLNKLFKKIEASELDEVVEKMGRHEILTQKIVDKICSCIGSGSARKEFEALELPLTVNEYE